MTTPQTATRQTNDKKSWADSKQRIIESLNSERWEVRPKGYFLPSWSDAPAFGHPTAEIVVTRWGSVFFHGARICFMSACIRKAAKRQFLTHLHCDLTGVTENKR